MTLVRGACATSTVGTLSVPRSNVLFSYLANGKLVLAVLKFFQFQGGPLEGQNVHYQTVTFG